MYKASPRVPATPAQAKALPREGASTLVLHATRSNGAEAVTLSKAVLTSRHVGVLILSV